MAKLNKTVFFLILFSMGSVQAETITAKRISSSLRLFPLKKVTVGPDDQYHGTVDPSGEMLVFTRKSDLVPHLCSQNIKAGNVTDLLPLTADSQEPTFNAEGEIAFTYYKFHAGGDICHKPGKASKDPDEKITCLNVTAGEPSTPFWKSSREIGYLLKDNWTHSSKIIIENLDTGSKQTIAEGVVWSPSMKPGGRYLFYNQMTFGKKDPERVMVLKDLQSGPARILKFTLPGISGFPAVSEDEKYLYFSHYLNDTNNDNVIDGNDNSVIFRAPIEALLNHDEVFPEQLTSVESNCSFPRPYKDVIYATCAFEGALDIYQLPTTGIVPPQWTEAIINNAHETGRSYSERILLLNTLSYRFPNGSSQTQVEERILSNHIMADDLASSQYYLHSLALKAPPKQVDFYTLLNHYLDARKSKKVQKSNEVSLSFEEEMAATAKKIDQVPTYPRFKTILKGLLETFLNHPERSTAYLKGIRFDPPGLSLERYLYFELAKWTLPRIKSAEGLNLAYHGMMSAPELSEEAQIYYAFHFLQGLQLSKRALPDRVNEIQRMNRNLPSAVTSLLKSESIALKLIASPDKKGKSEVYRELDQVMSSTRENYFLRKALNIRAILNFAEAGEFTYLTFIATSWLRYTLNSDTEFANARGVFALANLDRAYDSLGQKKTELANNYFFASVTLTDDLESHYGYIKAMLAVNQRENLNQTYKNLKEHQQIEDNLKFVEALLSVVDGNLDLALEKLKTMEQDRDSAMRFLLMGYCYLDKLLRLGSGYEFDQELFEKSHRNLMLAYDQSLDNDRVKASALMNLGLLHQRVQNHGLAAKFFLKRKALGFMSEDEKARFSWYYARSLYYIHQPDKASAEIESDQTPLLERKAFYLQTAGKFSEAVQLYEQLLTTHKLQGNTNLAKAYLSYGYSLFKLKKEKEAQQALQQSLEYTNLLQLVPKGKDRWVDFQPVRLKLVLYGLLSQLGPTPQRLAVLEKRHALLKESKELLDEWPSTVIQTEIQLAYLLNQTDPRRAASQLQEALKNIEELGDSSQYLANAIHLGTVDFLIHAIQHPDLYAAQESTRIQKIVEKTLEAYSKQKTRQPILDFQKMKTQILWAAYSKRMLKSGSHEEIKKIAESDLLKELKIPLPEQWKELHSLAKVLE